MSDIYENVLKGEEILKKMGVCLPDKGFGDARIVKCGNLLLRVYIPMRLIARIDAKEGERLALAVFSKFPRYLMFFRAQDYGVRGWKSRHSGRNTMLCFKASPLLVKHIFPNVSDKRFVPENISVVTDPSTGFKVVAMEWSGGAEFLAAKRLEDAACAGALRLADIEQDGTIRKIEYQSSDTPQRVESESGNAIGPQSDSNDSPIGSLEEAGRSNIAEVASNYASEPMNDGQAA